MNPIIIPVRTGPAMTRRAVTSALAQDIDTRILVIDNNASDCSPYIRTLAALGIQVIIFRPEIGLQRLWNVALNQCFDESDHALVINNDVALSPWTYRTLIEDGGEFVTAVGSPRPLESQPPAMITSRPHPDFSCFLIKRSAYEKVGPFDEQFEIYCGDNDYHVRMVQAGIPAHCLNLPFYHEASGTLKNLPEAEAQRVREIADADRERFKQKWGFAVGSREYELATS